MPVSKEYGEYVVEQLARVEPVSVRKMFGGLGIYARGAFFALADDDVLFFKVDDETRPAFDAAKMPPFQPYGPNGPAMDGYRELPGEVLDDTDQLAGWMKAAIGVALRARGKGKGKAKGEAKPKAKTLKAAASRSTGKAGKTANPRSGKRAAPKATTAGPARRNERE